MNPYAPSDSAEHEHGLSDGGERLVIARLLSFLSTVCCGFASSWLLVSRLNEVFRPNMPFGLLLLFLVGVSGSLVSAIVLALFGHNILGRSLTFRVASIVFTTVLVLLALSYTYNLPRSAVGAPIDLLPYLAIEILLPTAIGMSVFTVVRSWQNMRRIGSKRF